MSLFTADAKPGRPYWWDDVTWPDLPADLPASVDLVVVGAGYTGLSAAIAAHDAGARVVVLESGKPGEGASTRNGGMLGAHPRLSWDKLARTYGAETADALFAEAADALDWVNDLLVREGIDCDFEESGRIQLANTDAHFATQKALAAQVAEKSGAPCEIVQHERVSQEIKSPVYKGGILFPTHGGLHPAKYLLGLLHAALLRGIPVLSNCPALKLVRERTQTRVVTTLGMVVADKVILATNGYTGAPFPWFMRRVFPVPSFLIATEPLSPELIAELAPGRRMMVETRSWHSYFRLSPDGTRILFGGRAALVDINLKTAARRLHGKLVEIWPQLGAVKLSHVWTGYTGYTFGHLPHVGEHEGVNYATGYSGGGTVLAPWLGRKAALQALDLPQGETAFGKTKLQTRWYFRSGRPRFLIPANLWYRHIVDRREAAAARKS